MQVEESLPTSHLAVRRRSYPPAKSGKRVLPRTMPSLRSLLTREGLSAKGGISVAFTKSDCDRAQRVSFRPRNGSANNCGAGPGAIRKTQQLLQMPSAGCKNRSADFRHTQLGRCTPRWAGDVSKFSQCISDLAVSMPLKLPLQASGRRDG